MKQANNKYQTNKCSASPMNFWVVYIFLFTVFCSLFTSYCYAEDLLTVIIADRLEYFSTEKKYSAAGSVVITREDAILRADEATFFEKTSEAAASGNVRYDDHDISIKAVKADFNMEARTGKLTEAEVFYKKDNYHLSGKEIEKKGEQYYTSPDASVTTCDSPVPAWCFRGKDVDAVIGDRLKARDVTFRIDNLPVFYAPVFYTPIAVERKTGFLLPVVGYSRSRGTGIGLPFFWTVSENRDVTALIDIYSKRGVGTGLEYRFVEPEGIRSSWWAYHIKDSVLDKDLWEILALYDNRKTEKTGWFLNVNYVNEKDYYREYASHFETRTQRFLESTAEISRPLNPDSRLYLLSQYWVDLKNGSLGVPQKLPEAGYVLNYTNKGDLMFSASLTADNFWREEGLSARRLDIHPTVRYSVGKDFVFSQMAGLRETLYSYYKNSGAEDNIKRSSLEYEAEFHTRLLRKYESFTHVIEPSLKYNLVASSENNLPVFDTVELFSQKSVLEAGLLNRVIVKGRELAVFRITQGINTRDSSRPFLPLTVDMATKGPVNLSMGAVYDVNTGKLETANADIGIGRELTRFAIGQAYNRTENILMYRAEAAFSPIKSIQVEGKLWYDAKGGGARDIEVNIKYLSQCWGLRLEAVKKPGDFRMLAMFELKGLNSKSSRKKSSDQVSPYL